MHFHNRDGIELTGDLYTPRRPEAGTLPAIAVSGPFVAVKEQVSGLYAQALAARGFITLAFDPPYTGESSGEPRHLASPEISTEDFSATVDYLSTFNGHAADADAGQFTAANGPTPGPDRIGIVGICGWGGFALNAAAIDPRIKATVASAMSTRSAQRSFWCMGMPRIPITSARTPMPG